MANELFTTGTSGTVIYALVFRDTGQVWNGTAFETYAAGNYANYAVTMSELGAAGIFIGDFPATIVAGEYKLLYRRRVGGVPAENDAASGTDSKFSWNGSKILPRSAWAVVTVDEVPEARTWIVENDGRIAGTKIVSTTESGTFSVDFGRILDDNETSFVTADSVADVSANNLAITNIRLSGDKRKVYFDVAAAAWTVATTYTIRASGTAVDGNKYSGDGTLKTRA